MDLTTRTPVEIDTELAKLDGEKHKAEARLISAWSSVHYSAGDRKVYRGNRTAWGKTNDEALAIVEAKTADETYIGTEARKVLATLAEVRSLIEDIEQRGRAYRAEFDRRGGWTRAFLAITNGQGHVHSSMYCPTCNKGQYRTAFGWQPEYSGADEAKIVADAGYRACTVCYPSAPVGDAVSLPTKMFTQEEKDAAKAREDRAAAKAARDAKKIAAALTKDGSELAVPDGYGRTEHFKTERAATTWVVQELGYHRKGRGKLSQEGVDIVIKAIAEKHGKSIETVKTEIEVKVIKWIRRNFG